MITIKQNQVVMHGGDEIIAGYYVRGYFLQVARNKEVESCFFCDPTHKVHMRDTKTGEFSLLRTDEAKQSAVKAVKEAVIKRYNNFVHTGGEFND